MLKKIFSLLSLIFVLFYYTDVSARALAAGSDPNENGAAYCPPGQEGTVGASTALGSAASCAIPGLENRNWGSRDLDTVISGRASGSTTGSSNEEAGTGL